jgi:hypothetical protein
MCSKNNNYTITNPYFRLPRIWYEWQSFALTPDLHVAFKHLSQCHLYQPEAEPGISIKGGDTFKKKIQNMVKRNKFWWYNTSRIFAGTHIQPTDPYQFNIGWTKRAITLNIFENRLFQNLNIVTICIFSSCLLSPASCKKVTQILWRYHFARHKGNNCYKIRYKNI